MSGGTSHEVLGLVCFVFIFAYVIQGLCKICKWKTVKNIAKTGIIVFCGFILVGRTTNTVLSYDKRENENSVYIDELKGYFTELGDSIEDAKKRIGDKKIFSTYATAIEDATHQFQPSGIDYIIHVLGDKQREEYIDVFKKGEFDYAVTTDKDYNQWRHWIRNANWFFYKELYKNYIPEFSTEYNVFWKKVEKEPITEKADITVETKKLYSKTIKVKTENPNFDGVASLKIAYKSHFQKDFWTQGIINRYVYVTNTTQTNLTDSIHIDYNIPNKSDEYYIPVTIINGVGEVDISSWPADYTTFELYNAEIDELFDVSLKYCVASKEHNTFDNTVYIDNTKENQVILENAKTIKLGDVQENVTEMETEGDFIKLNLSGNADTFKYPNYFEVIKEGQ